MFLRKVNSEGELYGMSRQASGALRGGIGLYGKSVEQMGLFFPVGRYSKKGRIEVELGDACFGSSFY